MNICVSLTMFRFRLRRSCVESKSWRLNIILCLPEKGKEKLPDICVKPDMSWWKRNVLQGNAERKGRTRWNPSKPCNNREGIISFYASRHTSKTFTSNRIKKKKIRLWFSSWRILFSLASHARQAFASCAGEFRDLFSNSGSESEAYSDSFGVNHLLLRKTSMIDDSCRPTIAELLAFEKFIQEIIHLGSVC